MCSSSLVMGPGSQHASPIQAQPPARRLFLTCSSQKPGSLPWLCFWLGCRGTGPCTLACCHSAMALYFRSGLASSSSIPSCGNFSLASPKTVSLQPTAVLSPRDCSPDFTLYIQSLCTPTGTLPRLGRAGLCSTDRFLGSLS